MSVHGLTLEIVTPDGPSVSETGVDVVVLRRRERRFELGSEIAIFPLHAATLVRIPISPARYRSGGRVFHLALGGGFAEVKRDRVLVVTPRCERIKIIKHGEVQLTTEQRRKLMDEKRKQIADMISKQGINPQNKLPHPVSRILNAMDEAKVHVDLMKPAQEQVESTLDKIQPIIPIAFQRLEVAIKVPAESAGRLSSHLRSIATVRKEEWQGASFFALIEIPAGMQADIYKKLNDLTGGKVESRVVREIPLR